MRGCDVEVEVDVCSGGVRTRIRTSDILLY